MTTMLDVVCPAGIGEGEILQVEHEGQAFDVPVPPGVHEGDTFQVEVPEVSLADLSLQGPSEPVEPEPAPKQHDDEAARKIQIIQDAMEKGRLTEDQAMLLSYLMEALYDFDALDDFIDENAASFVDYEEEGEQRLEWTTIHNRYVALVEGHIADQLEDLGGNAEGLHLILAEAFAGDERAEAFLSRLLGMGDYNLFCTLMKAGGGALKVSLEDLRKLGDQYGSGSDSDE